MKGPSSYTRTNPHCITCTTIIGIWPLNTPIAPRHTGVDTQEGWHPKDFLIERDGRCVIEPMHGTPLSLYIYMYICTHGKRISLLFPRVIFSADQPCKGQMSQWNKVLRCHTVLCHTPKKGPSEQRHLLTRRSSACWYACNALAAFHFE